MALLEWILRALPELPIHENGHEVSIARQPLESVPSSPDFAQDVATRDVLIDDLSARIFLPDCGGDDKLPVILYFHGGGFLVFSSSFPFFHHFCESMARNLKALVVSVDYRLAPEHRLPAAYDDAARSLEWLRDKASDSDEWIASRGDLSRVLVAGDSAGGNIALYATTIWCRRDKGKNSKKKEEICSSSSSSSRFRILGIVLVQPFYGGIDRTESEKRFADGIILTTNGADVCWRFALPIGADRDHPYCNHGKFLRESMESFREDELPAIFMAIGREDCLFDRQLEVASLIEKAKGKIKVVVYDSACHAFYLMPHLPEVEKLFHHLVEFVTGL